MAILRMTARGALLIVTALLVSSERSFLAQPKDALRASKLCRSSRATLATIV
jgi:hypothetical protein